MNLANTRQRGRKLAPENPDERGISRIPAKSVRNARTLMMPQLEAKLSYTDMTLKIEATISDCCKLFKETVGRNPTTQKEACMWAESQDLLSEDDKLKMFSLGYLEGTLVDITGKPITSYLN